jgi:hypothetical protein
VPGWNIKVKSYCQYAVIANLIRNDRTFPEITCYHLPLGIPEYFIQMGLEPAMGRQNVVRTFFLDSFSLKAERGPVMTGPRLL